VRHFVLLSVQYCLAEVYTRSLSVVLNGLVQLPHWAAYSLSLGGRN
jgi:hypothetical protein